MIRVVLKEGARENLPIKMLDFPSARQSHDFSCGAAVVQAILGYYDIRDIKEDDIIKGLGTTSKKGTETDQIIKYLKKMGLKAAGKSNCDLKTVAKMIDQDHPVIISLQAWSDDKNPDYSKNVDSHYVVAIGYNRDSVFLEDPSLMGHHGVLSIKEFNERWHDEFNQRYAIFVWGKKPNYNSDTAERIE